MIQRTYLDGSKPTGKGKFRCWLSGHDFYPRSTVRTMTVHELDTGLTYEEHILRCRRCGYETT